ncbi:MAG: toll/interleukin-1 receptor domain-containing protein [Erythrobacter sp.]|nr:toll/interleukin-1 receptor domain-containing protein [Erythrobacter sp.]
MERLTGFVGYARRDAQLAELSHLLKDLEKLDLNIRVDMKTPGGADWWTEILRDIRESDIFVAAVTADYLHSHPCQEELRWAVANQRTILPVMLQQVPTWKLREPLASAQVIDYTMRCGEGEAPVDCVLNLRAAIEHLASQPRAAAPDSMPPAPSTPFATAVVLQPYLDAKELSMGKQEEFVRQVKLHRDDVDSDLSALAGVLQDFMNRRDIAYSVRQDIEQLLGELRRKADVAQVDGPVGPPRAGGSPPKESPNLAFRKYAACGVRVDALADNLAKWYENQHFEAQVRHEQGRVIVQCRTNNWARYVGAGAALTVNFSTGPDELIVEVGGARWMDKAAAGAVAWFVAWPAAIPATVGGIRQGRLPKRTFEHIDEVLSAYCDAR